MSMLATEPPLTFSGTTLEDEWQTSSYGYDAASPSNRRKSPTARLTSADDQLTATERKRLQVNSRDIRQNFTLAAWMVRKHLDYVARFTFQAKTGDEGLNTEIEEMLTEQSRPLNCDAARRHSLPSMLRLTEAQAVVDGDCGLLKVEDNKLQAIESDRIRGIPLAVNDRRNRNWVHGVEVDQAGAARRYAIHRRVMKSSFQFERQVRASRMFLHGYFDRFDQVRGISPMAPGLNQLRDVYENFDYALARAKISQFFAFAITSRLAEEGQSRFPQHNVESGSEADGDAAYDVNLGAGPQVLEMEPGDDAKFLESNQPSDQFQNFTLAVIQVALKALDIPFSFYSENFTNFFGSIGARQNYEQSCKFKRENLQELLRQITVWWLIGWINRRELVLPRRMSLRDLKFEWIPEGIPWWDKAKEIRGDIASIESGLDDPISIIKRRSGRDHRDVLQNIASFNSTAQELGVPISYLVASGLPIGEKDSNDDQNNA